MAAILNFSGHLGYAWSCALLSDFIAFLDPENIGIDIRTVYLEALITKL